MARLWPNHSEREAELKVIIQMEHSQFEFHFFTRFIRSSNLLVCPFCTSTWAKIQFDQDLMFWAHSVPCENCPWPDHWRMGEPGSLLHDDELLEDFLPPLLLHRELYLHLRSFDRIISMLTPEDLSRLQLYRARITAGEQMPIEEMREAMRLLRSDRLNAAKRTAATKSKGSTKAPKAAPRPVADLLGGLGITLKS